MLRARAALATLVGAAVYTWTAHSYWSANAREDAFVWRVLAIAAWLCGAVALAPLAFARRDIAVAARARVLTFGEMYAIAAQKVERALAAPVPSDWDAPPREEDSGGGDDSDGDSVAACPPAHRFRAAQRTPTPSQGLPVCEALRARPLA